MPSSSSGVANKDKPLCWFNRQPSNSSTGELDKEALSFNKDTYYVGFDANQGAELQVNSVSIIQLIVELENDFNIEFQDSELALGLYYDMNDVVAAVAAKLN